MKKLFTILMCFIIGAFAVFAQKTTQETNEYASPNSPIDNIGHWADMAERGVVQVNPAIPVEPAIEGSSMIQSPVLIQDSPDVLLLNITNNTQSENSVFVDPNDKDYALNSNNSEQSGSIYGANYITSNDGGLNWSGSKYGAGGSDKGDPAACIGLNGRHYIGAISSARKQCVSYSDNGTSWTKVNVESGTFVYPNLFDKNHLWIDNTNSSQEGNVYDAWIRFETGHANNRNIEFSRSTNDGLNWSTPINISSGVSAGYMDQGVNIQCNNTGWVFAVWAIHDQWVYGSYEEDAIGFARSPNGGASWYTANRIVNNIKGIRATTPNTTGKNMRVNSFPSMAVDVSGGPNHGHIYVVWANNGVPGTNTGTNVSIYLTKSTNGGTVWSTPSRVNASAASDKAAYFPWITCDPVTGNLFVIYYDDLNQTTSSTAVETFVAYSGDDGVTWTDMVVSDVAFTPSPIPGLAGGYFGDYLGISARGGKVYPVWTDNRSGRALTYVSPLDFGGGCIASGGCYEHISKVEMGTIDHSTACDNYANYRDISTDLPLNATQTITVTNGVTNYSSDQCGIWVDWNKDGDFYDAYETISVNNTPSVGPYTASITPPGTATLGECTMRIRITYTGAVDPCGETSYGEVEDYTINLTPNADNEWTGTFNYYWHNSNNWSLGHIPTASENVIITSAGYQPPVVDYYDEECHSLTIQSGAGLMIRDQSLTINWAMSISGELEMVDDDAIIAVLGNVAWNSGSTANITHTAFINVYGDWNFSSGANANFANGFVDFKGTSDSWIRAYSSNSSFYNLRNYKSGGAKAKVSNLSTNDLVVNNLTFVAPNAIYESRSNHDLIMKGYFNYYGTFDFTTGPNTGSVVFDGTSQNINNYSSGSGIFNNIVFSSTSSTALLNEGITVIGDLAIESGNFNPNNLQVTVGGNWTNSVGPSGFVEGAGRVVFNGTAAQYCSDETFNELEIDKASMDFRANNTDVVCAAYDWTNGAVFVYSGGSFTANDLLDNAVQGHFYLNTGSTINLTNSGSGTWVDLKGDLHITGGTMNVTGSISDWPYAEDASIEMSGGVLDFTSCGITLSSLNTLTSNITGGTIRTAGGFSGNRGDFAPTTGLFEFYGSSDAYISQSNGCTLHNVNIDKSAKGVSPQSGLIASDERVDNTIGEGKANNISLTSDFTITNDLIVTAGALTLNGHELTVAKDFNIYGTLTMDNVADILNVGTIGYDNLSFISGSTGNLSAGNVNIYSWIALYAGCSFTATPGNTINVVGGNAGSGIHNSDPGSVYGNVVINKTSGIAKIANDSDEDIELSGNFTLNAGKTFTMQDETMIVHGIITDYAGCEMYSTYAKKSNSSYNSTTEGKADTPSKSGTKGGYLEIDTDFTLNGLLDVADGDVLLHGDFHIASTGILDITTGTVVSDQSYQVSDAWQYINGTVNMTDGLFEYSNNSFNFQSTSTENISGGIIRCGGGFSTYGNVFSPSGGLVELTATIADPNVGLGAGSSFYNLTVNSTSGYTPHYNSEINITNNFELLAGGFECGYGGTYDLYVGGDWTDTPGGFVANTGLVSFNGTGDVGIIPGETFFNLTLDKASSGDWLTLSDDVTALGDLVVNGGALHTAANILDVNGNVDIDGGTLFIQAGGTLKVGDNKTLTATSGSNFFIEGSYSNYATLTHSGSGRYACNIYGQIAANYAVFEYMGQNGVALYPGATVNPTYTFNHCIFQYGAPAKGSAYLVLNSSNTFTSIDTYFDNAGGDVGNNVWKSVGAGNATFEAATGDFAGPEFEYDPNNRIHWSDIDVELGLEVMLEGPYNGSDMNTDLYMLGLIPTNQPFDTDPGADWYYTGSENVGSIPPNVVDWVLVQVRDASDAASAGAGTVVAEQAAFLLNNGSIVDLNGSSNLSFAGISYSSGLFPVVWHRNHLGIISSVKMTRLGGVYTYDFTLPGSSYSDFNPGETNLGSGVWGMFGGDANGSGWVYDGDTYWNWNPYAGETGYRKADFNLDGQLNNKDKDDVWVDSYNMYSQIPGSKGNYSNDVE